MCLKYKKIYNFLFRKFIFFTFMRLNLSTFQNISNFYVIIAYGDGIYQKQGAAR